MQNRLIFRSSNISQTKGLIPIVSKFFSSRNFTTTVQRVENTVVSTPAGAGRFFEAVKEHKRPLHEEIPKFLCNKDSLRKLLYDIDSSLEGNYLMDHFTYWLSRYAQESRTPLKKYFSKDSTLASVSQDFISFCFQEKIFLDPDKTLQSFSDHNKLSDKAVKEKLMTIKPKPSMNILGFGLDEGQYEKGLAQFLLDTGVAKSVNIYGFDPYALKSKDIHYLTDEQLRSQDTPRFDFIIARWVLHHVALKERWGNLIRCINHCQRDAMVLIVEHGFLKKNSFILDEKLYHLLNATFDVVANVGLRPRYFTDTAPNIGVNFFIEYLTEADFIAIRKNIPMYTVQDIVEVGPGFPNQTICSLRL